MKVAEEWMRFLKHWLALRPLSETALLNSALLLSVIPFLWVISPWLWLFFILESLLLLKSEHQKWFISLVMLLGLLLIGVDFFSEYSLQHLKRITVFASLIATILLHTVILQKLSGITNIYLKLAPLMFFTLSFFFFKTIGMLFFALTLLTLFAFLRLWWQMQSTLKESLSMLMILMLLALPSMGLLFLFFPRISFEKAQFGFSQEQLKHLGHDGKMQLDNRALAVMNKRVVMEVRFLDLIPKFPLYFRGSTLYYDQTQSWEASRHIQPVLPDREYQKSAQDFSYEVTLYPTQKPYLYTLYQAEDFAKNLLYMSDQTLRNPKIIQKKFNYHLRASHRPLTLIERKSYLEALQTHPKRDDKSRALIAKITTLSQTPYQRFQSIERWAYGQKLVYSLHPKALDLSDPVDDFLFGTKEGYCVHFAAAFCNLYRLAGIPARIVTGYMAEKRNLVQNYLAVKEEDAHAWIEIYLGGQWRTVEPTHYAYTINRNSDALESVRKAYSSWWERPVLYLLFVKDRINQWVIGYNRSKQKALIAEIFSDIFSVGKFVAILLLLLLTISWLLRRLMRPKVHDPIQKALQPLLHKLAQKGYKKAGQETMQHYLNRLEKAGLETEKLNRLYQEQYYGSRKGSLETFYREIKVLMHGIKEWSQANDFNKD